MDPDLLNLFSIITGTLPTIVFSLVGPGRIASPAAGRTRRAGAAPRPANLSASIGGLTGVAVSSGEPAAVVNLIRVSGDVGPAGEASSRGVSSPLRRS